MYSNHKKLVGFIILILIVAGAFTVINSPILHQGIWLSEIAKQEDLTLQVKILSQKFSVERLGSSAHHPGLYRIIGELRNIGPNALENVVLKATFFDAADLPKEYKYGRPWIQELLPGQNSPFEILLTVTPGRTVSSAKVEVSSVVVSERPPYRSLVVSDVGVIVQHGYPNQTLTLYGPMPSFEVKGKLQNIGESEVSLVEVVLTFYDGNGQMIDGTFWYTSPMSLEPGQNGNFRVVTRQHVTEIKSFTIQYTLQPNA